MKKFLSVVFIAIFVLTLVSCGAAKPKDFSAEGITITLTSDFKKQNQEGYTLCYASPKVAVFMVKEAFSLQAGMEDWTLDYYADLVFDANASKNPDEISKEDGLTTMEYSFFNEEKNTTYKYFSAMYKAEDAFWIVQFACEADDYEASKASFVEWAKTVKFGA